MRAALDAATTCRLHIKIIKRLDFKTLRGTITLGHRAALARGVNRLLDIDVFYQMSLSYSLWIGSACSAGK
jgi:hypothetical protein